MSKEKSLIRQTINWVKEIPHKLEILLNNLYTLVSSVSELTVGCYMVAKVIPTLNGYVATAALIAAITVAVDGGFKLSRFLMEQGR